MTPEPTPVSGMTPRSPAFALPVTVIRTTAGLTFAATAIVADDSSMVTGLVAPTFVPVATEAAGAASVERAGRVEREDRAAGGEDRGEEGRREDRSGAGALLRRRPGPWPRACGAGSYQRSGVAGRRDRGRVLADPAPVATRAIGE